MAGKRWSVSALLFSFYALHLTCNKISDGLNFIVEIYPRKKYTDEDALLNIDT